MKHVVLAAGGTGGHLYPAEALAEELIKRGHRVTIFTDKRGKAFGTLDVKCVTAGTARKPLLILKGIFESWRLLKQARPDAVVGFGGYPSFAPVLAAQMQKIPTIIHEQNAVLGKANLWLADRARVIALSHADTHGIKDRNLKKTIVTGNPVRASICAVRDLPYPKAGDEINIFITGGSQAASIFGAVVPEALMRLAEVLRARLRIVHQSKEAEVEAVAGKYRMSGVRAEVKSFYTDMPERLSACHLFIGRSGASTVAEIAAVGRPAIFVPYPGHKDQQQKHNAEIIVRAGGGWLMMQDDFTPEALAEKIEYLAKHPDILENAAAAAKSCGEVDAVKKLAAVVEERINA